MTVIVRFVNGSEKTYPEATSAAAAGPVFRVRKWNAKKGVSEDVAVLEASSVILAEVCEGDTVQERILGSGSVETILNG